ncbi:gustatory receptor for sugar taste 43a-like [Musca domestica]|uniref:Gustatory receptor n=1 Tax=Musca domestica TaxID=7370 RepID=A0A9J7DC89_MUSDO|nr:gustatory receptor for sugar taste 43a-like [Musca domestica]
MEISESSRCIYIVSKILGLAPFSVKKTDKGTYLVEKSIPFIIYASVLTSAMSFLTYRGLLFDATSKIPLRQSFRMKSVTSKAVTTMDVSVIVMAVTAGALCGIFGYNPTKELNVRLQKVDASINGDRKRDTLKAIMLLILPVISITILMFFDIWTWLSFAQTANTEGENTDLNTLWYIPFYGLYYILTCLHVTFANTTLSLSRRFKTLNVTLIMSFLTTESKKEIQMQNIPKITPVLPTKGHEPPLHISFTKITSELHQAPEKNKSLLLKMLAECHESLGKCVALVSSSYGMAVLFILLSCFLHLVATSYFLFMEFLEKNSGGFSWLQVMWITFHTSRLLLVVEPCHRVSAESSKTIHIICEIERGIHDSILAEEVNKFWQQQLVFKDRFSACGLVMVDRSLLTSIFSAIATYLVIIIQFQKSDG